MISSAASRGLIENFEDICIYKGRATVK